jgi:hypothetical protein
MIHVERNHIMSDEMLKRNGRSGTGIETWYSDS